ncbi:hypothetical protein RSOL_339770, partial [Rhizoctonia solani AG-3 Rhs1AP]
MHMPIEEQKPGVKKEELKQPLSSTANHNTAKPGVKDIKQAMFKPEDLKPPTASKAKPSVLSFPIMSSTTSNPIIPTYRDPIPAVSEDIGHQTSAPTNEQVGCIIAQFQGMNIDGKPAYCESVKIIEEDETEEFEKYEDAHKHIVMSHMTVAHFHKPLPMRRSHMTPTYTLCYTSKVG